MTEKHKTGPHARLGEAVHTLCQLQGWTTNETHAQTGVAVSTLNALFNGENGPDVSSTRKVLARLGVTPRKAVASVAARADEIDRIKIFHHIIHRYSIHTNADTEALAKTLFPDSQHPNLKYGELVKGNEKPSIQEVVVMLRHLGKKDIFELIAEAGMYAGHGASHVDTQAVRRGREQSRSTER